MVQLRRLGVVLFIACSPTGSDGVSTHEGPEEVAAGDEGASGDEGDEDGTTDDPTGGRELPAVENALWRRAEDQDRFPALAVEETGIRAAFDGERLIVRFRLPEPSEPLAWTLTVEGAPTVYELMDADARPRGGAWVQVADDDRPPLPGTIYLGAFSVDITPLLERDLLPAGTPVTVRFGTDETRITR